MCSAHSNTLFGEMCCSGKTTSRGQLLPKQATPIEVIIVDGSCIQAGSWHHSASVSPVLPRQFLQRWATPINEPGLYFVVDTFQRFGSGKDH